MALVFVDLIDSTSLLYASGTVFYTRALRAHRARATELIERLEGRLVDEAGDGLFAVFPTASSALTFGLELFRNSGHPRVEIRAGVHFGTVRTEGETVVGRNVHLAARVMQHGEGHQLWVSGEAKSALESESPVRELVWLADEECLLKGVPAPQRLWRAA